MEKKARILVVDDEAYTRGFFTKLLGEGEGYEVATAVYGEEALNLFTQRIFDLVLLDLKLPNNVDGMQILHQIKKMRPDTVVIMISGHGTMEIAVQAVKKGAENFFPKPFNSIPEILIDIENALAYQKIFRENALLQEQITLQFENLNMIGSSSKMEEVFDRIKKVASGDANIFLIGESGTGKELAARAIYKTSHRSKKTFMTVNCGALTETLLEVALFGCVPNAYTGAPEKGAKGYFEVANGGTLFLDEIGEASLALQVKLLRVLQEGEFIKVGGTESLYSDVRIISATNKDLSKAVEDGEFREDLYWRINVIDIKMPPLRERKEDIPLLAHFFLKKFVEKGQKNVTSISSEAMKLLMDFHWPGNIRQLDNVIQASASFCEGDVIDVSSIPEAIRTIHPSLEGITDISSLIYKEAKDNFDKKYFEKLLKACHGKPKDAAKEAKIDVATVYRKLREYDINY